MLIVGGGITGLVAAYLAVRAGNSVTVLEANAQFGGLLNTFEVSIFLLSLFAIAV
ncbi:MAG: FAD-dependent oxidoreductase [Saprospiraceae bacterium]|nr:FAD-dependent oxidoreductase [Saprospiraceae bacterium]